MNELLQIIDKKCVSRLFKAVAFLVIMASLFLIAKTVNEFKKNAYIGRDATSQSTISVTGMGEEFAKPDVATFNFSVIEEGKNVAEAQTKATEKMTQALSSLEKNKIDKDKDVKTLSYNISPKYEYYYQAQPMIACASSYCPPTPVKQPKIVGYEVSQTVEVKVRKIDSAGDVLTAIGGAGVKNLSDLSFSVDDMDVVKSKARASAIEKAKDKAKVLADSLGVSLVRVVSFSEGYDDYYPVRYGMAEMAKSADSVGVATSAQIPTGESKVTSNVTVTYEIR